jgi:hypothetical protein
MVDNPDAYVLDHCRAAAGILEQLVQQSMERQGRPRAFLQQLQQLPPIVVKAKQAAVTLLTVDCVPVNSLSVVNSTQWLSACVPP